LEENVSVKTKMTDAEVKAAFAALAGAERVEGVLLREVTVGGVRWLNPDPTPMSAQTAAEIVRSVVEAAPQG
jgi:hypothetical protein